MWRYREVNLEHFVSIYRPTDILQIGDNHELNELIMSKSIEYIIDGYKCSKIIKEEIEQDIYMSRFYKFRTLLNNLQYCIDTICDAFKYIIRDIVDIELIIDIHVAYGDNLTTGRVVVGKQYE